MKKILYLYVISESVGEQALGSLKKPPSSDLVIYGFHYMEKARTQGWASAFVVLDVHELSMQFYTADFYDKFKTKEDANQIFNDPTHL